MGKHGLNEHYYLPIYVVLLLFTLIIEAWRMVMKDFSSNIIFYEFWILAGIFHISEIYFLKEKNLAQTFKISWCSLLQMNIWILVISIYLFSGRSCSANPELFGHLVIVYTGPDMQVRDTTILQVFRELSKF